MIRIAAVALILSVFLACGGGGPKRIGKGSDLYVINATLVDPARSTVTFSISVHSQSSQGDVKDIVDQVVARYKTEYPNMTIKTYLLGSDQSELPFATSIYADGAVTHFFNTQPASQKIPTH
jgi:hypothetical protein